MNITPQESTTQPISDDQELAKALAGVLPDEPEDPIEDALSSMEFEETTPLPVIQLPTQEPAVAPIEMPAIPEVPTVVLPTSTEVEVTPASNPLDAIKNKALDELRPLIDKVNLPTEEKFDTYLMLIRSTDDSSLIGPAHEAAQAIADESRKAEALIDIIKEIDYLSKKTT